MSSRTPRSASRSVATNSLVPSNAPALAGVTKSRATATGPSLDDLAAEKTATVSTRTPASRRTVASAHDEEPPYSPDMIKASSGLSSEGGLSVTATVTSFTAVFALIALAIGAYFGGLITFDDAIKAFGPVLSETNANNRNTPVLPATVRPGTVTRGGARMFGIVAAGDVSPGDEVFSLAREGLLCPTDKIMPFQAQRYAQVFEEQYKSRAPDFAVLAVYLLSEASLGTSSRFQNYIASLGDCDTTASWTDEEISMLEGLLAHETAVMVRGAVDSAAHLAASLFALEPNTYAPDTYTRGKFEWAACHALTRGLALGQLGECIVPVADLFNDGQDTSAYPRYDPPLYDANRTLIKEGRVIIVSDRARRASEEIPIHYGAQTRLTLARYGFVAEDNPSDALFFTFVEDRPAALNILGQLPIRLDPRGQVEAAFPVPGLAAASPLPRPSMAALRTRFLTEQELAAPGVSDKLLAGEPASLENERAVLQALRGAAASRVEFLRSGLARHVESRVNNASATVRRDRALLAQRGIEADVRTHELMLAALDKHWASLLVGL